MLLKDDLIECTNGREGLKYCMYANADGMVFVRESNEFFEKFTQMKEELIS